MKMHKTSNADIAVIRHYDAGEIGVNDQTFRSSIVVTPAGVTPWEINRVEDIDAAAFDALLQLEPEIIIVGSGSKQHFLAPSRYVNVINRGVGIEFMSTPAACRTYNVVAAEGRLVLAALIIHDPTSA